MTNSDSPQVPGQPEQTRVSRLAVVAMITGAAAVMGALVGIGPILGVVAFGLGALSLSNIKKQPQRLAGVAYAQAGLILGLLAIPLGLVDPGMHRAREGRQGPVCAANITGTVKGFIVYANDNNNVFPTAGLPTQEKGYLTTLGTVSTATDPDTALMQIQSAAGAAGNPMSAMWILILRNFERPKNLVCNSDPNASSTPSPTINGKFYYLNPAESGQISYSIAYPYASATSVGDWWKNGGSSDLPVMSDMAPLNGTGSPKRDLAASTTPRDPRTVNSGNHHGDGQNVGFADAHCEWKTNPLVGQNGDNLWTLGTTPARSYGGAVISGGGVPDYPPTPKESEAVDIIMVPVRDLETGQIK